MKIKESWNDYMFRRLNDEVDFLLMVLNPKSFPKIKTWRFGRNAPLKTDKK